jgi:glycosyltransferase involved in cell wall biosynthesis
MTFMRMKSPPKLENFADRVVVAIPVKNEEARIASCLAALQGQSVPPSDILLLLNNCSDRTAVIAQAAAARDRRIRVGERDLPAPLASAGEARRLALAEAAALAGPRGVIITTDADCQPEPGWVAKNIREIAQGADVVCGAAKVIGEPEDEVPGQLHFDLARESMYAALLDEIAALVDPDPADPWPRHQQHSGASIAMTAAILRAAGGAPRVPSGEDRALIARFRLLDAKIRHAPDIEVAVSGRLDGRAKGGMAEALRRRAQRADVETDDALEPAVDAYRRVLARASLRGVRAAPEAAAALARDLLIREDIMDAALQTRTFGAAWAVVENASPVLRRRRLRFVDLARETRHAIALRAQSVRDCFTAPVDGQHAG